MTNFKNSIYKLVTDKRTVPFNSNGTGTIETVGLMVKGTGTAFKTEMPAGSWLVDESQDEIRYVDRVDSDTVAFIRNAFTSDIAALTTPSIIHEKETGCVTIALQIPSGQADGEIDGEVFPAGTSVCWSKDSRDHSGPRDLVNPVIIDGTGTQIQVLISK